MYASYNSPGGGTGAKSAVTDCTTVFRLQTNFSFLFLFLSAVFDGKIKLYIKDKMLRMYSAVLHDSRLAVLLYSLRYVNDD